MITRKIDKHVISQPKEVEFTCYVGKNGKQFVTLWDAILADLGVDLNPQKVTASAEAYILPGATLTLEAWCANHPATVEEYKKDVRWVEFKHDEEHYCGFRITCEKDAQKVALLIVNKYYLENVIAHFGFSKAMERDFTDWYFDTCLANIACGADSVHPYCGYFSYIDRYDHPEMFYGTIMSLYYDVDRDMNILRKEMNAITHVVEHEDRSDCEQPKATYRVTSDDLKTLTLPGLNEWLANLKAKYDDMPYTYKVSPTRMALGDVNVDRCAAQVRFYDENYKNTQVSTVFLGAGDTIVITPTRERGNIFTINPDDTDTRVRQVLTFKIPQEKEKEDVEDVPEEPKDKRPEDKSISLELPGSYGSAERGYVEVADYVGYGSSEREKDSDDDSDDDDNEEDEDFQFGHTR